MPETHVDRFLFTLSSGERRREPANMSRTRVASHRIWAVWANRQHRACPLGRPEACGGHRFPSPRNVKPAQGRTGIDHDRFGRSQCPDKPRGESMTTLSTARRWGAIAALRLANLILRCAMKLYRLRAISVSSLRVALSVIGFLEQGGALLALGGRKRRDQSPSDRPPE